jgi:hypothetical protein
MNVASLWARVVVLLVAVVVAIGVTGPKLYKMGQIMGWVPGAVVTREAIVQKGHEPATSLRRDDSYWVSWVAGDVRNSWKLRDRVSPEVWHEMREGDPIDVVHLPGDPRGHLRVGVYVEPGNFAFDVVLFVVELTVAVVMSVQLFMQFRRARK